LARHLVKVLVTGHKGFIGSHVYGHLKEVGHDVSGFDLGDKVPEEKFDLIVHMAARGLIRESVKLPYNYFKDDLDLAVFFLEKARLDSSCFVFPTSGSTELPTNPYSLAKKQAVEWIELYQRLYGLKSYVLRLFNVYGEGSRKGLVYLSVRSALTGQPITVYGDGSHVRDYFYVGDVVKVVDKIVGGELPPGEYECGTGSGYSVMQVLDKVESVVGKDVRYSTSPYAVEEAQRLVADRPVLKDCTPLEAGLRRVVEFVLQDLRQEKKPRREDPSNGTCRFGRPSIVAGVPLTPLFLGL